MCIGSHPISANSSGRRPLRPVVGWGNLIVPCAHPCGPCYCYFMCIDVAIICVDIAITHIDIMLLSLLNLQFLVHYVFVGRVTVCLAVLVLH